MPPDVLAAFAEALFARAGLAPQRARVVAEVLLEGDLLGHPTHGLGLAPLYVRELATGGMARAGEPRCIADRGAALTWDGALLPGPWLLREAISQATERLKEHPVVTVVIRRSHHSACLQAYLADVVARGHMILLACSDPGHTSVAPFGAVEGVMSPNPIAAGIPSPEGPILLDLSTSATAFGQVVRAAHTGESLAGPWLITREGAFTADASAALDERRAALYPLGGEALGYKGFALGLLVEALTQALGGHGRAVATDRWSASVFLQLIQPVAFGGHEAFMRESGHLVRACRAARVPEGRPAVRVPGEGALARRAEHLARGVTLPQRALEALIATARDLDVPVPEALV